MPDTFKICRASSNPLSFPVLTIKGRSVYVFQSIEPLTETTPFALKNKFHEGWMLVSRDLHVYQVESVEIEKSPGLWASLFTFTPRVIVSLSVRLVRTIPFEEVKSLLLQAYDEDPTFWNASISREEFASELNRRKSVEQIWALLAT